MGYATTELAARSHLQKIIEKGKKAQRRPVLYFIGGDEGPVKIGYSCNLPKRLATIQAHSPIAVRVLAAIHNAQGGQLEAAYHYRFAQYRLHGEWFERSSEIVAEIERLSSHAQ
jgi:hypothetical protein